MQILRGLGLAIVAGHLTLQAANVIDQVSPGGGSNLFGIESLGRNGQSFTPAQNNISGLGLGLKSGIGSTITAPVTVEIWDRLWTASGAVRLVQQTGSATAGPGFTINDIFWTPVAITPGQRYFARFFATDNTFITGGFIFNPYPGGTAIVNNSPGLETGTGATDMIMRTFYDTDFQSSAGGVPEPGTIFLMAAGLLVLRLRRC